MYTDDQMDDSLQSTKLQRVLYFFFVTYGSVLKSKPRMVPEREIPIGSRSVLRIHRYKSRASGLALNHV